MTSTRPPSSSSSSSDPTTTADPAMPAPSTLLARRTVGGFLWTTLAWGSNRLAVLGLTLVLARLLAPADFGLVTAALTVIAVFDAALDLGVGAAVVAAQDRGISLRTRTAFSLNLALSALVTAIGVGCSGLVAGLFHAEGHAWLFALLFCYPLFRGAGQVNDAVLTRDLAYRRRTVVGLCRAAVRIGVSVPLALTVGGAFSIAAGLVVSELAAMVLLWSLVPIRPVLVPDRGAAAELLRFGGKVALIRVLGSFRSTFDYIVVGSAIGVTALGYYGMAYKLPELLIENVLWIVTAVALPTYARALTIGRHLVVTAMVRATRLLALYGLAVGTVLAVLARESVPLVFSPQWRSAVVPMMLISLSLGLMAVAWASGDVFTALGRPGTLVLLDLPATAVMAGAFVYAARYGLVGVAAVHLVFNLLYCLARMALVRRALAVSAADLVRAVLPGVAVAACVAGTGFGVQSVLPAGQLTSLLAEVAVCGVTVVGASLVFARTAVVEVLALALSRRQRTPARTTVEIT